MCNYCSLKSIKVIAKINKKKVTVLESDSDMVGTDVFVHPKNIKMDKGNKEQRDKYFIAWMMAIGTYCQC